MQILDRKCILDNLLSLLGFDFLYYFCCGSPETLEITSRLTQSRTILASSQQKNMIYHVFLNYLRAIGGYN